MSSYKILNNIQIKFIKINFLNYEKRKFLIICKVLMKPMEKKAQPSCPFGQNMVNVKIPT